MCAMQTRADSRQNPPRHTSYQTPSDGKSNFSSQKLASPISIRCIIKKSIEYTNLLCHACECADGRLTDGWLDFHINNIVRRQLRYISLASKNRFASARSPVFTMIFYLSSKPAKCVSHTHHRHGPNRRQFHISKHKCLEPHSRVMHGGVKRALRLSAHVCVYKNAGNP